jgi:hypothetical protein
MLAIVVIEEGRQAWLACGFVGFKARRTLAITWPQSVLGEANDSTVAAQVHGDVSLH